MAVTIFPQPSPCLAAGTSGRCQASKFDPRFISKLRIDGFSVPKQNLLGLGDFSAGFIVQTYGSRRNMNMAVRASVPPEAPFPADPSPGHWKVWILGALVTILLSFSKGKWGPLLQLKEKVETTIEEAEQVSDIVEEVAEKVEKVAEEAVKHLPKGKLQDAAHFVEQVAEEIDKDAHIAGDALEKMVEIMKVEETEKEVESFLESTTHQEKTAATAEAKDQK